MQHSKKSIAQWSICEYHAATMSQTRFEVGDVIRWTALAAMVLCDETATVVEVFPHAGGVEALDQYTVITNDGRKGTYFAGELEKVPSEQLRPVTTVWHRRASASR